jgi:hypothetical protein
MAITLTLAALGGALLQSNPSRLRRRRPSRGEPKIPADLLRRRVAQGGREVDHRLVIRFGLHDANEPEETRRKIA